MTVHPLFVLIRDNFILTVHCDEINRLLRFSRYAPQFFKKIAEEPPVDKITLVLERIIDENNDRNYEYLREIEMHGDAISKSLIEEKLAKKRIAHDFYSMKHVLFDYLNVLWATKDVIDSLRYGDADLITNNEKLLGRIGILSDNIDRHIELSEQMSNVFPAGTLTGAPKIRAMQVVDELEREPRGLYGGAVGYLDFAGQLDFCIAIRTLVLRGGRATVQAGAGIVADSDPHAEQRETEAKAEALRAALRLAPALQARRAARAEA